MTEGRKDDTGKLRFDLIPPGPFALVADVYTRGATKYADRNWENGLRWGRVFKSLISHAWKWWAGERYDREDGQHHLASVAWCCLALMEYENTHPELDDRPYAKDSNGAGAQAALQTLYAGSKERPATVIVPPQS